MRRGVKRKLKIFAVDAAMLFMALQMTVVFKGEHHAYAEREYTENNMKFTEGCEYENDMEVDRNEKFIVQSRDWGTEDAEILLRIAMAEAEGEGVEGKAYVMAVVLNRVWSDEFPKTIKDVVFQNGQFGPTKKGGRYWTETPDQECYEAYEMVLHGWDESDGALYFCTDQESTWLEESKEYLYTVGKHDFYR